MMNNVYYPGMAGSGSSMGQSSMHEDEIEKIINEVKSQGVFDEFRRDCISDVDTKPAYQNLRSRVETSIQNFLEKLKFDSTLNKNIVRENLRKHVLESSYYNPGLDRITDQIVNPKMMPVLYPKVEKIVCDHLNIPYVPSVNPIAPASLQPSLSYANTNGSLNNHIPSLIPGVSGSNSAEHKDEIKPQVKRDEEVKSKTTKESETRFGEEQGGVEDMDTEVSPKSEPMEVVSSLSGISDLDSHDENSDSNASSTGSVSHKDTGGHCTTADTGDESNSNWANAKHRENDSKDYSQISTKESQSDQGTNKESENSTDESRKSNKDLPNSTDESVKKSQKSERYEDSTSNSEKEERFLEDSSASSVGGTLSKSVRTMSNYEPDLLNVTGAVDCENFKSDDGSERDGNVEKKLQVFADDKKDDGDEQKMKQEKEDIEKSRAKSGDKNENRKEKSKKDEVSNVDEKEDGEVDDENDDKTETSKDNQKEDQEKSKELKNERCGNITEIIDAGLERISSSDEDFESPKDSEKEDNSDGKNPSSLRRRKSDDDKGNSSGTNTKKYSKKDEKIDSSDSSNSDNEDSSARHKISKRNELKSSDAASSEDKSRDSMAMEIDEASQESTISKQGLGSSENSKDDRSSDLRSKDDNSRKSDLKDDISKKSDTKRDISKGLQVKDEKPNDAKDNHETGRDKTSSNQGRHNRDLDKGTSRRDNSSEKDSAKSSSKDRSSDRKSSSRYKSDGKSSSKDRHSNDRSKNRDDDSYKSRESKYSSSSSKHSSSSSSKDGRKAPKKEGSKDKEMDKKDASHITKDKGGSSSKEKSSRTKESSNSRYKHNDKKSSSSQSDSKLSSRDSSSNRASSTVSDKDRETDSRSDRNDKHRSSGKESSRDYRSDKSRHSKERSGKSDSRYRSDSTKTDSNNRHSKRDRPASVGDNDSQSESELKSEPKAASCRDYEENRVGRSPPKSPEGDKNFGSSRRGHGQKSSSSEGREKGGRGEAGDKSHSEKKGKTAHYGGDDMMNSTETVDVEVTSYTGVSSTQVSCSGSPSTPPLGSAPSSTSPLISASSQFGGRDSFTPPPIEHETYPPVECETPPPVECKTPPRLECTSPKHCNSTAKLHTPSKEAARKEIDHLKHMLDLCNQRIEQEKTKQQNGEAKKDTESARIERNVDTGTHGVESNLDVSHEITEENIDTPIVGNETKVETNNSDIVANGNTSYTRSDIDINSRYDKIETKMGTKDEEIKTKLTPSCVDTEIIKVTKNQTTELAMKPDSCDQTFLNGKPNVKLTPPNVKKQPTITSVIKTSFTKTDPSSVSHKLSNAHSSTKNSAKHQCVKKLVEINMWDKEKSVSSKLIKHPSKVNKNPQDRLVVTESCKKDDQTEPKKILLQENENLKEKREKELEAIKQDTHGSIQDIRNTKEDVHSPKEIKSNSKQDTVSDEKNDNEETTTIISLNPEMLGIREDELINALQVTVNLTNCCNNKTNTINMHREKETTTEMSKKHSELNLKTPSSTSTIDKIEMDPGHRLQIPKRKSNENHTHKNSTEANKTFDESYSKKTATGIKEMLKISRERHVKKQKSVEENGEEINGEKENKRTSGTENTDCRKDMKKEDKQMQDNEVCAKITHYKKLKASLEKQSFIEPKNSTLKIDIAKVKNILDKLAQKKRLLTHIEDKKQIKGHNNARDESGSEKNKPGDILRNITTMQATMNKESEQKMVNRLETFGDSHTRRSIDNKLKEDKKTVAISSTENSNEKESIPCSTKDSFHDEFDIEKTRRKSAVIRKLKLIATEEQKNVTDSPIGSLISENKSCSDESDEANATKEKSPKLNKSPVSKTKESRKIAAIKKQLQELKNKKILIEQSHQSKSNDSQNSQKPSMESLQLTPSKMIIPAHMIPKLQLDPCDELARKYATYYRNNLLQSSSNRENRMESKDDDGEISEDDIVAAIKRKIAQEIKNKVKSSPPRSETNTSTSPRQQITSSALDDLIDLRKQKNDVITVYNRNHQSSQSSRCETRSGMKNFDEDMDRKTNVENEDDHKENVGVRNETQNDGSTCERLDENDSSKSSSYLNNILDEEDEFIKRYVMPVIESRNPKKFIVNKEKGIVKSSTQDGPSQEILEKTSIEDSTCENTDDEARDDNTIDEDCSDQKDIKSKIFEQLQKDFQNNQEKYTKTINSMDTKDDKSRIFEELEKHFYSNPLNYIEQTAKKLKSPNLQGKKKKMEVRVKARSKVATNEAEVNKKNKMSLFEKLQQDFYHNQTKQEDDESTIENDGHIIEIDDETDCENLKKVKRDVDLSQIANKDKTDDQDISQDQVSKREPSCEKENIHIGETRTNIHTEIKDLNKAENETENSSVIINRHVQGKDSIEVAVKRKTRDKREISKPIRYHSEDNSTNKKVSPIKRVDGRNNNATSEKIDKRDRCHNKENNKKDPEEGTPFAGFKITEKIVVIKKIHSYTDLVIAIEQFERFIPKNCTLITKIDANKRGQKRKHADSESQKDNVQNSIPVKFNGNKNNLGSQKSVGKDELPRINNKEVVRNTTKSLENDSPSQDMVDDDYTATIKRSRIQRSSEESGYESIDLNAHEEDNNDQRTSQDNRSTHYWHSRNNKISPGQNKPNFKDSIYPETDGLKVPSLIIRRKPKKSEDEGVDDVGGDRKRDRESHVDEWTRDVNTTGIIDEGNEQYRPRTSRSSNHSPCNTSNPAYTSRNTRLDRERSSEHHIASSTPMRDSDHHKATSIPLRRDVGEQLMSRSETYTAESLQSMLDAVNNDINDHVVAAEIKILSRGRSSAPHKPRRPPTGVQRYDSEDLYKPRLSFQSKRRKLSP